MRDNSLIFRVQEPPAKAEQSRDYSSCRQYGRMVTVLGPLDNPSVDPELCYRKMRDALEQAQDGDYLLWSGGDPMSAFIAGVVVKDLGLNNIRWLRWDRKVDGHGTRLRQGYYVPVPVEFRA